MVETVEIDTYQLKAHMNELGFSGTKLAKASSVDRGTLSNVLKSGRARPDTYAAILRAVKRANAALGRPGPESLLVGQSDVPQELDSGQGGVVVRVVVKEYVITIEGSKDKLIPENVQGLLDAMSSEIERRIGPVQIVIGSIKIYCRLTEDEAQEIAQAADEGRFEQFGNVTIELSSVPSGDDEIATDEEMRRYFILGLKHEKRRRRILIVHLFCVVFTGVAALVISNWHRISVFLYAGIMILELVSFILISNFHDRKIRPLQLKVGRRNKRERELRGIKD